MSQLRAAVTGLTVAELLEIVRSARGEELWFVSGHDLADDDPYTDENRAKHGVEPIQGHHLFSCAVRNCFL